MPIETSHANEYTEIFHQRQQGKYDKADELFLRAIGISERNLGDDHLTSALHRANRANLLMKKVRTGSDDMCVFWASIALKLLFF